MASGGRIYPHQISSFSFISWEYFHNIFNHHITIITTPGFSERSFITWIPSPIYENVVVLLWIFSTSRIVSAYANVVVWECFVLMTVVTDATKLATLTLLTMLFYTGLESFSVFYVVLNFPTKYSFRSLRI